MAVHRRYTGSSRQPSFWGGSRRGKIQKRRILGIILLLGIYVYIFYSLFVSPFSIRWRGIFRDTAYPEGYSIRGLDVSHHQGKINWKKVGKAEIGSEPVSFVFLKATEGVAMVDRCYKENYQGAADNGLLRGAYHYFLPNLSAHRQAHHFIKTANLSSGDLSPVLDVEESRGLTPAALQDSVHVWLDIVEKHYHVRPIIYTGVKFKQSYLSEISDYPFWLAHYYVKKLQYTGRWDFWQHSDRGQIDGIRGDVDVNVYNGSMYNLRQLTIP